MTRSGSLRAALRSGAILGLLAASSLAGAHEGEVHPPTAAPTLFAAPEPGSYELPPIARVGEHRLLDPGGGRVPLLDLAPGQLALVSFVYTHCPSGGGCPAATAALKAVDQALAADPALAAAVRMVTVSFDPARDDGARMAAYRDALRPRSDWRFLTAASEREIAPVLDDFGQDRRALVDERGRPTGLVQHVLKVYLVDASHAVRNIYSAGFLAPELLLADLETLRREAGTR